MEDKMEQKYGKVIFDPTSEEAKALEGRDVEGCLSYDFLSSLVCKGKMEINEMCSIAPFIISERGCTFIRAIEPSKEPSYAERQTKWVAENGVKIGTKVRVTRAFCDYEDGYFGCWSNSRQVKIEMVGKIYGVQEVLFPNFIKINDFLFPYFVLEVVKEPTYRPFTDEEMIALYGKTLVDKNCLPQMVVGLAMYSDGLNVLLGDPKCLTTTQLFNSDYTLDGHKCGVKV
jgi:hypothetical protein